MKKVKSKAFVYRLKGHNDQLINLYSPCGPTGALLFSVSKEGCVIASNLAERKTQSKLKISRQMNQTVKEADDEEILDDNDDNDSIIELEKQSKQQQNQKQSYYQSNKVKEQLAAAGFTEHSIYGGYTDGQVCCWNIKTGTLLYFLDGHTDRITNIIALNQRQIMTSSLDKTIRTWDSTTAKCEIQYRLSGSVDFLLQIDKNHVYAVVEKQIVYKINIESHEIEGCVDFNNLKATCFWVGMGIIIFGTIECNLEIYSEEVLNPEGPYQISGDQILPQKTISLISCWALTMKELNGMLFLGCDDSKIKVYNINDNLQLVEEFVGHRDGVTTLEFADGLLISGSYDHRIKLWDLEEMLMRIEERNLMHREDVFSRKIEVYNGFLNKKKKKKRGKKGKKKK